MITTNGSFDPAFSQNENSWWLKLERDILQPGLCTQCGTCVGLSKGLLEFQERTGVPIPTRTTKLGSLHRECYDACPARFCSYPALNKFTFQKIPENWLSGVVNTSYIAHAQDEDIRRNGASGGVITATLIHLLETKQITGAICLRLGKSFPHKAEPIIARTREEIMSCAQSIYSVTPVNTILDQLENEKGPLAYVGLPDQVASVRKLQMMNHPDAKKIKYIMGPYMGTQMYFEAIRSFLRSHSVKSEEEIISLKYRAGEWPGHLEIKLKDGRVLTAEKFYYNYLIPFFIASSSLQLVDFTNELTDISVGDAWSPQYEQQGKGFSVVLARSAVGNKIMREMQQQQKLVLEEIPLAKALDMHGHMLDFKKRGSFIRNSWKKVKPEYSYFPRHIPFSRKIVERLLQLVFVTASMAWSRWLVEHLPLRIVGPLFNTMRKYWKSVSKPTKRKGLREMEFIMKEFTEE